MRSFHKVLVSSVLCIAALGSTATAASAASVSGVVKNSAGYRIALVKASGKAKYKSLKAKGTFKFTMPTAQLKGATLHLVRPNGRYFGPIVLKSSGTKAYLQLSGKAGSLGAINRRTGFAKVAWTRAAIVNLKRAARATKKGAPVGAGKLGYVRKASKAKGLAVAAVDAPDGADTDTDGVSDVFDVDDDGDLTLDPLDSDSIPDSGLRVWFYSVLNAQAQDSLNVNMGAAITPTEINALLREWQGLTFSYVGPPSEVAKVTSVNVDCGALTYCRRGDGTGVLVDAPTGFSWGDPWISHDPDSNGLPNMWNRTQEWFASIWTHADLDTVHIGDVFRWDVARGSATESLTAALNYFFVTTPAIKSHTSGGVTTTVAYPVADNGIGTFDNPATLSGTSVALQLWRPQRTTIPGAETGDYRDMGGLFWGIEVDPGGSSSSISCGQSTISGMSSSLEIKKDLATGLFLHDTAADAEPNPANTVDLTVDLAACLTAAGKPATGKYTLGIRTADIGSNVSVQRFTVQLP